MGRYYPSARGEHSAREGGEGTDHLEGVVPSLCSFTDPNIYYQTFTNYDEVNFYRESLFQIIPKSNFDLHDTLLFDEKVKEEEKANLKERAK